MIGLVKDHVTICCTAVGGGYGGEGGAWGGGWDDREEERISGY